MRKIIYSLPLKIIAVLLFCTSIVLGALTATAGVFEYQSGEANVYSFESDFSNSQYIAYLLREPEYTLINAYRGSFSTATPTNVDIIIAEGSGRIAENIKKSFANFYFAHELDYYVKFNDLVITNCDLSSPKELMHGEYTYTMRGADGNSEHTYTHRGIGSFLEELNIYGSKAEVVISARLNDEATAKYEEMWTKQRDIFLSTASYTGAYVLAALVMLVYLLCVCGKRADGECKNIWVDKVWLEVQLAISFAAVFFTVIACAYVIEARYLEHFPQNIAYAIVGASTGICAAVALTVVLSALRNVKTGKFLKTSVIACIIKWVLHIFVKLMKWIWKKTCEGFAALKKATLKKTGVIVIAMLFFYTAIIGLMGILTPESPIPLIIAVFLFLLASIAVAIRAGDTDEIKKGAHQIRLGNTGYKIPTLKSEDLKELAEDVNDIARGLDESVAAKVKAERMKSELITNVSHDLKTPITSIISYAELLSSSEGLSEEAKDYVAVIAKKGERLKKLTQDLFDVSKAHSGNEVVTLERLDASLLVEQALAEYEREIEASHLVFCTSVQKQLYVLADGRKMSRVIGNLIDNILKYTLTGSRVFVSVSENDGNAQIELKNVSAYPIDFDAEEITARFVRGDESRSKEGNGLGLAIAKSYTELCGGTFKIVLDGDMFKAIIRFKTV